MAGSTKASYLSQDLEVEGDIMSSVTIVLRGRLVGTVRAETVSIDEGAFLSGSIEAERAVVGGHLEGSVLCDDLKVAERGEIIGDIRYRLLEVFSGGRIVGPVGLK